MPVVVAAAAMKRVELLRAAVLFFVTVTIFVLSPCATPFDSRWTVPTATSIVHHFDANLNEYLPLLERDRFYAIECVKPGGVRVFPVKSAAECAGGNYYTSFPVAVPILSVPFVAGFEAALKAGQPLLGPVAARAANETRRAFLRGDLVTSSMLVELLIASLWMAAATVVVYFTARECLPVTGAMVLAGLFAFATPVWSICSRALWQHSASVLLLSIALLLATRAGRNAALVGWLGVPLALAFYSRPTNAVPVAVFTVFVVWHHRDRIVPYFGGMLPVVALFTALNLSRYGTVLSPYFFIRRQNLSSIGFHATFLEALAGNLISPARGLLVYSPIALLCLVGLFYRPRDARVRLMFPFVFAILVLHWLLISSYGDWIGGQCYGPRYFSDMSAVIIWLLFPLMAALYSLRRPRFVLVPLLGVLTAVSVFMQFQGACQWECIRWNVVPNDVRQHPERIWDWKDPPFLRESVTPSGAAEEPHPLHSRG